MSNFNYIEKKFSLKRGFIKRLLNEDDWSFIIKLHSLIEMHVTTLIIYHLEEPRLYDVIRKIDLCNTSFGKIIFLKSLGLLTQFDIRYIKSISELRNKFVHNIEYVGVDLKYYINGLSNEEMKRLSLDFSPSENKLRSLKGKFLITPRNELFDEIQPAKILQNFKEDPKLHIWIGACSLLSDLIDMEGYSDFIKNAKNGFKI